MKHGLFDCLFVYENYPHFDRKATGNATLLKFESKYSVEKLDFPLSVIAFEIVERESVTLALNYAGELFEDETIEDLLDVTNDLLTQVGDNYSRTIRDLTFVPEKQKKLVSIRDNATHELTDIHKETTLHSLFEKEVSNSSEKIAVVYEDVRLTYRELNEKANQLAHYLRSLCSIRPDDLIALLLDKSELMIVSILGVWKTGAAYVPVDPSYPDERIQFILEDTKAKMIILNKKYVPRVDSKNILKIEIDCPVVNETLSSSRNCNPDATSNGHNLAYVIYTSGTTGKPKGVLIEHQSVVYLAKDLQYRYFGNINTEMFPQTILLLSNFVFDASVQQFVLGLFTSNKLLILGNQSPMDNSFYTYLNKNRLTYLHGTPSEIQQIDLTKLSYLRILTTGGEPFTRRIFETIRNAFCGRIVNIYGITETTISNMIYIYENEMKYKNSLGCVLSHTKRFVLNKKLQMLPVHAVGELYLTGNCIARGYLNRPELTAERFLPNPFQTDEEKKEGKNARIYKTGDIVRWLPDGELEYLGRNDFQVKIRGLRIELSEIESVLSSYVGVKRSVVLAKEHTRNSKDTISTKYLLGYYVADKQIAEHDLKNFMETKLPNYMIPNRLIHIDKIPVTINGKLDTKALPDIDFSVDEIHYVAPRNELESKLCEIWSDVLGIDKIGITDDFFRLGGDSIGSLQIVARTRRGHGLNISVKDIFIFKTIQMLYENKIKSQLIQSKADRQSLEAAELGNRREDSFLNSLLPIQEYLLKRVTFSMKHRNQCAMFRIPRFDEHKLNHSLTQLLAHHDVFRIRFMKDANGKYTSYYQNHLDSDGMNVVQVRSSLSNTMDLETELSHVLMQRTNVDNCPMYMVAYSYEIGNDSLARVWIFMDELILDWRSMLIICEDLQWLYKGTTFGSNNYYKHWQTVVRSYVENIGISEVNYWESLFNSSLKTFNKTIIDKQRGINDVSKTELMISTDMTIALVNDCNKIYNTQIEHLLLTGLGYTLHDEITNLKENYVMFECCARDFGSNVDMDRSIGMFRTIYPVRLELADHGDVRSSIINVKEHMKHVPNKGVGFGAIINTKNKEFPLVSFNYLGLFERENNENDYVDQWVLLDAFPQIDIDESTKERIKITAYIINKQLRLQIKTKFGIEKTCHFGKALELNIQKIIQHMQSIDRTYLTESDVNYVIKNEVSLQRIQSEREVDAIFMANSLQQGLLYHSLKQSNFDDAYIVQSVFQYRTKLDHHMLKLAWQHAQKRFSCLRLRFDWQDELFQIIDKKQTLDWRFIDLSADEDVSSNESEIKRIQETDRKERFQLDIGNLFRIYLIRQTSDLFLFIFSSHHIIMDGWSLPILLDFVHQEYLNLIECNLSVLTASSSFRDESYENAQIYLQNHRQDNVDYWEHEISNIDERCDLSGLLKEEHRNTVVLSEYDHVKLSKERTLIIRNDLYRNLKRTCRECGVTLSSILQFVWHKILNIYGNSDHTVTGTTVSGRNLPINDIENSVGLFINTLPLIVNHNTYASVIDGIQMIQEKMNEMNSRSNVDFSQLSKGKMKHGLFDCLFVYENYPHFDRKATGNATLLKFESKYSVEKLDFPLSVIAFEIVERESVTLALNYAGELFEDETIEDLLDVTNDLLTQVGDNYSRTIRDLTFVPEKQKKLVSIRDNATHELTDIHKETTLHSLFEKEVSNSSEKIAVVYEDVRLTYRELNEKANQLAHYLRSLCSIRPDDLIALLLDKSELMIVSILGVWKTGAAYVPVDPSYPDERIQFILEDTKAKMIILNKKYVPRVDSKNILKIEIDCPVVNETLSSSRNCNPDATSNGHNLAYVIYTSGTTGKPKGVLIEHQSVVYLAKDLQYRYFGNINTEMFPQTIAFMANYVFDASIEQLALGVLTSNKLLILGKGLPIDDIFYNYLNNNRLTYISGTPSQIEQIDFKKLRYLNLVSIGGEPLTRRLFERIRNTFNGRIINEYGITETTVWNMIYIYENEMKYKNSLGCVLSHTKRFVLNKKLQMLPVHAVGELYLTGNCIARGYLNRPELTAERFLPNPFQTDEEKKEGKNARIYKTGDIVRWLPDGELEYLGRNDFQVKIRGLRIELSEIESVLSSYVGVKRSVVLAKEHTRNSKDTISTKYLLGYYVADKQIAEHDLKNFMETKLPNYMIPNRLIHIDKIPVTINGKLDTKALPDIDFSVDEIHYVAPRNELESKLCEIWSDVLGIDKIGITDDFFRLGGDSVRSVAVIGRIRNDLDVSVSVMDVFSFRTIDHLCQNVVKNIWKTKRMKVVGGDRFDDDGLIEAVPLLPIQEWFFCKHSVCKNHWNQSFLIETPILDSTKLKDSLMKLVEYHDAFKLRYKRLDGNKYVQFYHTSSMNGTSFPLNVLDIRSLGQNEDNDMSLDKILTEWQSKFDIENGPLFAVGYLSGFAEGTARIWFAMHHLIIDAVSWRVICDDLRRLYYNLPDWGEKGCSYKQWSQLIQSYGVRKSATEGVYWRNLVRNVIGFNDCLSGYCVVLDNRWTMNATSISLSTVGTSSLLRDCPHAYGTHINVLLLTALGYALKELTRNRINYVTLEGHGREDIDSDSADISRTVGWFTTMYPVLLEIDNDLRRTIMNINVHLLQVPNKGIGYGTIIGYKDQDLPRVSFNYLGQFEVASSAKTSITNSNRRWYLIDGVVGDVVGDNRPDDVDVITLNGLCREGQIRFDVKSRLNSERTVQFANSFKSKLEDIIHQCFVTKPLNEIDYSKDFDHPFFVLNADSNNILFILPPGNGGAESYFNNIVPHLSSYKLVLFNNYYLNLKEKHMEKGFSFETLAHLYIKYIKLVQFNGPYNFLGWSFGGVLSFEISRQLNNAGDKIANIFMIDSHFNMNKAFFEIDKTLEADDDNQINYSYLPQIGSEPFALNIANQNIHIVLFKAYKMDESSLLNNPLLFELSKYYVNAPFNCLDTFMNPEHILLFQMLEDDHGSWVSNKEQIAKMCNYITSMLK